MGNFQRDRIVKIHSELHNCLASRTKLLYWLHWGHLKCYIYPHNSPNNCKIKTTVTKFIKYGKKIMGNFQRDRIVKIHSELHNCLVSRTKLLYWLHGGHLKCYIYPHKSPNNCKIKTTVIKFIKYVSWLTLLPCSVRSETIFGDDSDQLPPIFSVPCDGD